MDNGIYVPIRDQKIRFGIVGCGRISKNHFEALEQHAEFAEIAAVCDTNAAALAAAVERTRAPGFRSIEEMLSKTNLHAVVVATPSGLHSEHAIRAAQAGYHVVTEKPMATRWNDGKKMLAAADAAKVRLFVVKQNRSNQTLSAVKHAIELGRFGRIYMVNVNVFWSRPQSYYDTAAWRGTWEFDGGAFMNQASHYVDLLDWLIGPVESVQSYTATLARSIEVEDTGVASIRWRSGTLGSINVSMLTHAKNFEGSITILGEKGTVRVGGIAVNEIQHWEFAEKVSGDDHVSDASYQTNSVYGFGHSAYYENVIHTLRGEEEPKTDGREGLRSLELLIAIYTAARDGRRVSLPLDY